LLSRFTFAQRARCAAAIRLRPAADILRRGVAFCFAHRFFCAKLIRLRADADRVRLGLAALTLRLPKAVERRVNAMDFALRSVTFFSQLLHNIGQA
jgi:hypothetical protein